MQFARENFKKQKKNLVGFETTGTFLYSPVLSSHNDPVIPTDFEHISNIFSGMNVHEHPMQVLNSEDSRHKDR